MKILISQLIGKGLTHGRKEGGASMHAIQLWDCGKFPMAFIQIEKRVEA